MTTIYLAGPINGCDDHVANAWRDSTIEHFDYIPRYRGEIEWLNPMSRDYRGKEAGSIAEIVTLDKRDVDRSNILVARVLKPSVGTSMEILYAWERGIPVILWVDAGTDTSPWLLYHATTVVLGFDDAMEAIERMLVID